MRPPVVEKETVFSRLVESKIFLSLLRSPQKYNAHFYSKRGREELFMERNATKESDESNNPILFFVTKSRCPHTPARTLHSVRWDARARVKTDTKNRIHPTSSSSLRQVPSFLPLVVAAQQPLHLFSCCYASCSSVVSQSVKSSPYARPSDCAHAYAMLRERATPCSTQCESCS